MALSDDPRCRGLDEPHAFLIRTLTAHLIPSSDLIIDSSSQPSFASNALKVKALEACQKKDFATMILYVFEALTLLEQQYADSESRIQKWL